MALLAVLGFSGSSLASDAAKPFTIVKVADGLDHPWGIAFLPDGAMLVTERPGRLRIIRNGVLDPNPISGTPPTLAKSQGGYFDIVLHPRFTENSLVYLTYAHAEAGGNATRVLQARFDGQALQDPQVIFTAKPLKDTFNHYGGRMAFLADGTFLLTIGDGFEYREAAQDLKSHLGKVVRLNDDGSVPQDNPFVGRDDALPEIWTWGHRNQQAIVFDPASGKTFLNEHGPRGGDEINILEKSKNYGWPVVTYSMDYSGAYVSPYTEKPGMEQPILQWTPSIAPSGMAIYAGDKFPGWQGDLLVSGLISKMILRVDLEGSTVKGQERLIEEKGDGSRRFRDVRVGPDGYVYLLTDETKGEVLRLEPAAP